MTALGEQTSTWQVTGVRHGGVTVSDLDRALDFYCGMLGLELLWRRRYEERDIADIVGVPEATAFDIAFLRIPGSTTEIELLQYEGIEQVSGACPPSRHGTGHFCLFVDDAQALYDDLSARGVRFRSDGPVTMSGGANKGGKSLYALDPDGYVVELHQRPPQAA